MEIKAKYHIELDEQEFLDLFDLLGTAQATPFTEKFGKNPISIVELWIRFKDYFGE